MPTNATATHPESIRDIARFTPGDWQEYNARGGRIYRRWRVVAGKRPICALADIDDDERYNAVLIAHAPRLLVELVELVDYVRRFHNTTDASGYLESAEALIDAATCQK